MRLGRELCGHWPAAVQREWLVTNGLGGYACGTVALANTRRYHAFLMASLSPPVERTLLVAKVDVAVDYAGRRHALTANEFADGTVDPRGFLEIESFAIEDGIPVWRYALADALLEQRIFMAPGANVSYLTLVLSRAGTAATLELKPLLAYRPMHQHQAGGRPFATEARAGGCTVRAFEGARPIELEAPGAEFVALEEWYWRFLHRAEAERGLDALEDLFVPGVLRATLAPGEPFVFTASAGEPPPPVARAAGTLIERSKTLRAALPPRAPSWVQRLATASDQFLVRRGDRAGHSIIAGYPWFADWGRDTMIALPGLATVLGRHEIAAGILRTYAGFIDGGMLPNRFPDEGSPPEYNTADATLWMFRALEDYLAAKRDLELASELYPVLERIVEAHLAGTRFHIGVDPADGLLHAGEPGLQLTWMDAKQGDTVFTPRMGKPVEINALWLNALSFIARLAGRLRAHAAKRRHEALLERAAGGFRRFWNPQRGCLYDVIDVDGGEGVDAGIRPNQLFAVSLPFSPLAPEQMRAVVGTCARELLTSYGLRSLARDDARYRGRYAGGPFERDAAYHQGTVWAWLMGPFVRAHYRAYGNAREAQALLNPVAEHLGAACVGSVSEIFEGDAPHSACGCFAQAWSVAEILHSWIQLEHAIRRSPPR